MCQVDYNDRTSSVSYDFYWGIEPEGRDAERDMLAIAKFLVFLRVVVSRRDGQAESAGIMISIKWNVKTRIQYMKWSLMDTVRSLSVFFALF